MFMQNKTMMEEIEGKNGRKVAIDLRKANLFAIVLFAISAVVFMVPYFLIWMGKGTEKSDGTGFFSTHQGLCLLIGFVVGIVVHELIHGLTWACYAKRGWKSISFGVIWKYLTPYCHCDEPMRIRPYQGACLMPFVVLGVIPSVAGLVIGSLPLIIFGVLFIAAAAGDIWMAWLLTKENPRSMVLDHPSEAGFYVFDESTE